MPRIWVEQVADRASADLGFVRRLIALGAIGPSASGYAERGVHVVVVALLHLWERAGLSSEAILAAVEAAELSWSRRSPQGDAVAGEVHQGENLVTGWRPNRGLDPTRSRKPVHQESFETKRISGPRHATLRSEGLLTNRNRPRAAGRCCSSRERRCHVPT